MKDQEKELSMSDLKKFVEEGKEKLIELCKCIEGYDGIADFDLDAGVFLTYQEESCVDTLYITDNLGNIDMMRINPPLNFSHLQKYHFSRCEYVFGYKIENRDGYYIEVACIGEE